MPSLLTDRQRAIFDFLCEFIDEHGYPPSYRDIMRGVDISSTSTVAYNLRRLEDEGLIELDTAYGRTIRVVGDGRARGFNVAIPHAGWMVASNVLPEPVGSPDCPRVRVTAEQLNEAVAVEAFAVHVLGVDFEEWGIASQDMLIVSRFEPRLEDDALYVTWDSRTQQTEIVAGRGLGETRTIQARLRSLVREFPEP